MLPAGIPNIATLILPCKLPQVCLFFKVCVFPDHNYFYNLCYEILNLKEHRDGCGDRTLNYAKYIIYSCGLIKEHKCANILFLHN